LNSGATTAAKLIGRLRDSAMEAEEDEPKSHRD
jgi:hypothetical protein